MFENRWNDKEIRDRLASAGDSELQQDLAYRVYTSQLIGQVPDLVMHGGCNTSCKSVTTNIFGVAIDVLCVKGLGWDLGTIEAPGLPAVKLAPLLELWSLDALSDKEMVDVHRANLVDSASPNPRWKRFFMRSCRTSSSITRTPPRFWPLPTCRMRAR